MGGGQNHRMGLHDMVLIKDNHIAVSGSIENALNAVKGKSNFIQIEVDTIEQLQQVLKNGNADSVLLDNMNLEQLKNAVQIIDKKLVTEASGGITLENVKDIAETGINRISIGALTHTITPIDFGLDYSE
jgi:nicotinate-nucleotide pyrophosphorylase (carboxylating)